jgi:hypothetical protein
MMFQGGGLSFRTRIARSIFWLTWSRGVLQVLSFATTLVIPRILVRDDCGVMALAGVWTGSVAMLAEMGLGAGIIRFRDLDRNRSTPWSQDLVDPAGAVEYACHRQNYRPVYGRPLLYG